MARLETENLPCGGSIPPLGTLLIGDNIMKWISIYDKLPEKSGRYLVTFTWGEIVHCIDMMEFHKMGQEYRWITDKFPHRDMTNNVIAWMEVIPYLNN